jgi:hypothetical protein
MPSTAALRESSLLPSVVLLPCVPTSPVGLVLLRVSTARLPVANAPATPGPATPGPATPECVVGWAPPRVLAEDAVAQRAGLALFENEGRLSLFPSRPLFSSLSSSPLAPVNVLGVKNPRPPTTRGVLALAERPSPVPEFPVDSDLPKSERTDLAAPSIDPRGPEFGLPLQT